MTSSASRRPGPRRTRGRIPYPSARKARGGSPRPDTSGGGGRGVPSHDTSSRPERQIYSWELLPVYLGGRGEKRSEEHINKRWRREPEKKRWKDSNQSGDSSHSVDYSRSEKRVGWQESGLKTISENLARKRSFVSVYGKGKRKKEQTAKSWMKLLNLSPEIRRHEKRLMKAKIPELQRTVNSWTRAENQFPRSNFLFKSNWKLSGRSILGGW